MAFATTRLRRLVTSVRASGTATTRSVTMQLGPHRTADPLGVVVQNNAQNDVAAERSDAQIGTSVHPRPIADSRDSVRHIRQVESLLTRASASWTRPTPAEAGAGQCLRPSQSEEDESSTCRNALLDYRTYVRLA